MDFLPGTVASLWIDFVSQTGLLIPDIGSVRYSLYDQTGNVLLADQQVTPEANASGVAVNIDAVHNSITAPRRFEKRLVVISWTTGGKGYQSRHTYRIIPVLMYTATAEDVRIQLGLNEDEITNDEVDLFAAYLDVESQFNQPAEFTTALTSGDRREVAANEAIATYAAINLLPSIRLRVTQSITNGPVRFERYRGTPDWLAIEREARTRLAKCISIMTGIVEPARVFIVLSNPTDPITGGE